MQKVRFYEFKADNLMNALELLQKGEIHIGH